jgi:hypothetical protein
MTCFFCEKSPATRRSLCSHFDSLTADGRRFVVTPRCDGCADIHDRQINPSRYIWLACAIVPAILAAQIRPWLALPGLIAGAILGIFAASQWEARGPTRPKSASVQHEAYRAFAGDAKNWRERVPRSTGRMETVDDYANHYRNDPHALAAIDSAYAG